MAVKWPARRGEIIPDAAEVNDLSVAVTWANIPDANVPESAVTQHEAALNHDALLGFVAEEHIRWDLTGAETINADRLPGGTEINDLTAIVTWANIPIANVPTGSTSSTVSLGDHLHDGILDTSLLDKTAVETVAGAWTFSAVMTLLLNSGEKLILKDGNSTGNAVLNFIAFKDMNDFRQGFIGFGSSSNDNLSINNALGDINLVAANTNVSGALTATSYDGVLAANLLDKIATETITGAWNYTVADAAPGAGSKLSTARLYLSTKDALTGSDTFLRLNNAGDFTNGVFVPNNFRIDGEFHIGTAGANAKFTSAGALTALSYGGITEANLLDKAAAESISGQWDFTNILKVTRADSSAKEFQHWRNDISGADLSLWYDGANFEFRSEGSGVGLSYMKFDIASGSVTMAGALTAASYGGITEANLLDKTAAEIITNVWTFNNGIDLADKKLDRPLIEDYAIQKHSEGSVAGVLDLNMALGNSMSHLFTANVTSVTVTNPPPTGKHGEIWLRLTQHASSPKTIVWPAKFKFPGKIDHVMSNGINEVDIVHMVTIDGGVTYDCTFAQDMG